MPARRNPDDARQLGEALRQLRETAGMTQVEAGEAAGVRSQFVSEIERASRGVSWTTLRSLLRAYGAQLSDLAKLIDG
ncbi:MAG TPA: helix-turn-helix transcriptional regulator [Solirubrobacteraceae bacterium]|nr:helix-turn-helix transcriptional regulator [Solirubrobacteraceae bacterium]